MKKTLWLLSTALLCQSALAQNIVAENAFARATIGQPQSGAFVNLKNIGKKDDVLIDASVDSSVAELTELHTHIHENGVMKMRQVKEGIPVLAGTTQELKPGRYHIMLLGLKKDLTAGQTFPITLKFQSGETQKIEFTVREMRSLKNMPHGEHDAHGSHHTMQH